MKFQIPGTPQTWKRVKRGRYGQTYDPNVKHKKYVGQLALEAKMLARSDQTRGSLMACMTFYIADRRRRDLDNLVKVIMDALNDVIYVDDSQIVKLIASKEMCDGASERTEIEIFPIKA